MTLRGSSQPASIISSHPLPTLLQPEPLFLMSSLRNTARGVAECDDGLSAFWLCRFTTADIKCTHKSAVFWFVLFYSYCIHSDQSMTEPKSPPPPPGELARWQSSRLLPIVPCDEGKSIKCTPLKGTKNTDIDEMRERLPPVQNTFNPTSAPSASVLSAQAPPAWAPRLVLGGTS